MGNTPVTVVSNELKVEGLEFGLKNVVLLSHT